MGDDVAVLLIEVGESSVIAEHVHALALAEDHANWAVFEDEARFALQKNAHLLIDHERLFAPGAEGLCRFDQEVEQRRVPHQAVDLIDRDDARLLVDKAVAADGAQHLGVGQGLQDWVAFQFVE